MPHRGTDLDLDGVFYNSAYGNNYCDGGTGGIGVFRHDTGCWTGFNPLVSFSFK